MTTEPTVSDVLRKAAEILAERGHCKGALWDSESRVCMWGAIRIAQSEAGYNALELTNDPIRDAITAALGVPDGWFPGVDWNDAPERTGTDVEKFLIGLADKAEFGE